VSARAVQLRVHCAALASAAALIACGFHLQGRVPLPAVLAAVHVEAEDPQTDFVQSLNKALAASGARLVRDGRDASSVVRVLEDESARRVVSVSASNIPREYEITYKVRYEVVAGERELLPPQELAGSRSYSFDERILLAKEHEEDLLREALADDLAGIVMRRLSSL
jgi:LPS-assembly lipoprotein